MFGTIWNLLPKRILVGAAAAALAVAGGTQLVVDSQDHITTDEAKALKAEGAEILIQGITYWSPCREPAKVNSNANTSLRNAQAVELRTAAYILVDPHSTGREAVDRAKAAVSPEVWDALEFVAVDFEVPAECYPAFRIPVETIYQATDYLRELGKCVTWTDGVCKAVLYTSCGEWHSRLFPSNPLKPSNTVLWNASWDGNPDIDYARCQFGSFRTDEVYIEQWSGGTVIGGVHVDQNTLVVFEPPVPQPPPITPPSCTSCCDEAFFSREQGLHALASLSGAFALEQYRDDPQVATLHPFDKAVVRHIACQMQ